ncbi:MAG: hypothetical protein WBE20_03975, partial [Candidatus Acidiferrales bacterium]
MSSLDRGSSSDGLSSPSHQREIEHQQKPSDEPRTPYRDRERTYALRASEIHTLIELGTFRAVDADALAEFAYDSNHARMEQDLKNLARHSLIARRNIEGPQADKMQILTLTKAGQRFLSRQNLVPRNRPIYHGFVKPKEARHDSSLYRVYQKVARKIVRDGGKNLRVALDFELKKNVYRDLAKLVDDKDDPARKSDIAKAHGLRVVNGRITVPDLQVEYETPEGDMARVNIELATKHYRPRHMEAKAQA